MKRSEILKNSRFRYRLSIPAFVLLVIGLLLACQPEDKDANVLPGERYKTEFEAIRKMVYENPSLAREKSKKIISSISNNDQQSKILSLKYIGSSYAFETNYFEAIKYYKQALLLAENINFYFEIANLNNNLGTIYNEFGNYPSAYIYFVKALKNYDLAGTIEKKTGTLNNIGLTYLNLDKKDKALYYFQKALNSSNISKDTILTATILNNIAICNFSKKQLKSGLNNLHRSIQLSQKVKNIYGECVSYQILGNMYLERNAFSKSLDIYKKSVGIAKNANLIHLLSVSEVGIARVLLAQGHLSEAMMYAKRVASVAEDRASQSLKADAHQLLSSIYEKNGNSQLALKEYRNYVRMKEEINSNTVVNQVYDVEVDYLNQLTGMQRLELEKKQLSIDNRNIWLLLLAIVFIMIVGGLYLSYRYHKSKEKLKLQETIIELTKKKSHAALEAEIRERKRIGREIHDSLGYLLSLAGLNASVLEKKTDLPETKKSEILSALIQSINEAFDEVRNISHNLTPSLLSEQGLAGTLKNIADRVNQTHQLKMSYDTFGLEQKLDDVVENILYRTIQEIVNNTIKHAEATELFIQVTKDQNVVTLMAEDNGKGFEITSLKEGSNFGLTHIRSWVENLSGSIHVDSKLKRGTITSILIPIR